MTENETNTAPSSNTMTDTAAPTTGSESNNAPAMTATNATNATTEPADVPVARVHGAGRFSEEFYWSAHTVGLVLFLVAVVLLVVSRGPRRREALLAADGHDASTV